MVDCRCAVISSDHVSYLVSGVYLSVYRHGCCLMIEAVRAPVGPRFPLEITSARPPSRISFNGFENKNET